MASRPIARITAVTPEPQVVMIGLSVSIPALLNAAAIFRGMPDGRFRQFQSRVRCVRPACDRSAVRHGAGLGAGETLRLNARRQPDAAIIKRHLHVAHHCDSARVHVGVERALWTLTSPESTGRPSCVQTGRPPSRMNTLRAPKILNVHQTRGRKTRCYHKRRSYPSRDAETSDRVGELVWSGHHVLQIG